MSIPDLCQACYKHYRSTVVKACPFCDDVQFAEAMLCDLVQAGQSEKQPFRCAAFRPALSVVRHDEIEASPAEEGSEDTVSMSPKDNWFRAYVVQQLSFNPDLIEFTIRYHVVLSARQRTNVFASEHREPMADLVRQAALPFEQTTPMSYGWHQITCICILMPLLIMPSTKSSMPSWTTWNARW
jgi:hypothetical protein